MLWLSFYCCVDRFFLVKAWNFNKLQTISSIKLFVLQIVLSSYFSICLFRYFQRNKKGSKLFLLNPIKKIGTICPWMNMSHLPLKLIFLLPLLSKFVEFIERFYHCFRTQNSFFSHIEPEIRWLFFPMAISYCRRTTTTTKNVLLAQLLCTFGLFSLLFSLSFVILVLGGVFCSIFPRQQK